MSKKKQNSKKSAKKQTNSKTNWKVWFIQVLLGEVIKQIVTWLLRLVF